MTPIAYWNFEDYIENSGYKDKINNVILRPSSVIFPEDGSVLPNEYFHGVRGSGTILTPKLVDGYTAPQYSGYLPYHFSGDFSFAFWCASPEASKADYYPYPATIPDYALYINRSIGDYYRSTTLDTYFNVSVGNGTLEYGGAATFTLLNSGLDTIVGVSEDNLDIGRWNFIYCENDKTNSKIGISINGGNKTYTNYPSGFAFPNIESGNINLASKGSWTLDELTFWDQKLSQEKLLEYYHNICPASYSGDVSHQWLYPQYDVPYNTIQDDNWYADRLFSSSVPIGQRWEYVNEAAISTVVYGTFPTYTDSQNNLYNGGSSEEKIRFGTGKLFVKPSSVIFNSTLISISTTVGGSGVLKNALLCDKNNVVIASSINALGITDDDIFTGTNKSTYMSVFPYDYWDLSETYLEVTLSSAGAGNFKPGLCKVNALVSGTPIMETGIPLVASGGPKTSSLDLYIPAHTSDSSGIDLYTYGKDTKESGFPIYMFGTYIDQSGLNLYTGGYAVQESGLNLYTISIGNASGGFPMYTHGVFNNSGNMPLFITSTISSGDQSAPLFTYGDSGVPTILAGKPLFLFGNDNLSQTADMPLYLMNSSVANSFTNMPLFLDSNTRTTNGLDLILQNTADYSGRQLRLFVRGDGELDGASIKNGSMPLFMERTEGTARGINMYLRTNDAKASGFNMYMNSVYAMGSGLNNFILAYDSPSGQIPIFTCGY